MLKFILSICLFLYSHIVFSQSIELRNAFITTSKFWSQKKYEKFFFFNEKAIQLSLIEFGSKHNSTATLLENKGRLLIKLKKFKEAQLEFEKVLKIRKNQKKINHLELADTLNYLSISLRMQKKFKKALQKHDEVLNIMSKIIATNPGKISDLSRRSAIYRARALHTKGDYYRKEGLNSDAEGNYIVASRIYITTLGQNSDELKEVLSILNIIRNE